MYTVDTNVREGGALIELGFEDDQYLITNICLVTYFSIYFMYLILNNLCSSFAEKQVKKEQHCFFNS